MKQLKDYLHLYLGCDIYFDNKIWKSWRISQHYISLKIYETEEENSCFLVDCKPILRPLSDMTEDEDKELYEIENRLWIGNLKFEAFKIKWYLSKHFDVFGLIEAGLAIDKITLTNK